MQKGRQFEIVASTVFERKAREVTAKNKTYKVKRNFAFRVRYKEHGKAKSIERGGFASRLKARSAMTDEIGKLKGSRGRSQESRKKDFNWLVEQCEASFLKSAEYRTSSTHGRVKTSGLKSFDRSLKYQLKPLKEFLGTVMLDDIEIETLEDYKAERLSQYVMGKDKEGNPREIRPISLTTAHRELALARRIILYGYEKGWIEHNPFRGSKLIRLRDEEVRTRTVSDDEQKRLIAACSGKFAKEYERRTKKGDSAKVTANYEVNHVLLRSLIVVAIETGFRLNELKHVRWQDIDDTKKSMWILPGFTKTGIGRRSVLTEEALDAIHSISKLTSTASGPFAEIGDIKTAWQGVRDRAIVTDLRFHDLRATFASRTAAAGVPLAVIQKLLGHSTGSVTERHYIVIDDAIFSDALASIEKYKKR